jgi:hypothetical protein
MKMLILSPNENAKVKMNINVHEKKKLLGAIEKEKNIYAEICKIILHS